MCGIAGIINLGGASVTPPTMQAMTDAMAHRGPDGEGHWIEDGVGLGHRRLAIIDLSPLAHQPMISHDGRFVLSYNGEIYNFRELRAELEVMGYQFRSRSDSEVLLTSWTAWGVRALDRFNGMFAFAIWDRTAKVMTLARDRYGIKPLYISQTPEGIIFGSEQKVILAHAGSSINLDCEALLEYFTFQNLYTNRTLVQGITMLPAGHYAVFDTRAENPQLKSTQYWDFKFTNPTGKIDHREYVEELDRLFTQAVKRQLVTDVGLGCYLSGGMDSGSISAVTARSMPNLKTFTCGFNLSSASGIELAFDERVAAEAMSTKFQTEHYEVVLKAVDMERCLAPLVYHLEEPRVGQSYPNYYAAQLASKFVKVVMSGTGGDELFGGYPWRYYRAASCRDIGHYVEQYYGYWQRLADNIELQRMFTRIEGDVKSVSTREIFREVVEAHDARLETPEDFINQSLYFEAKTFLHGLFVVEDKLSMAHGLETRVPFMDNDLVEFAMNCPLGFLTPMGQFKFGSVESPYKSFAKHDILHDTIAQARDTRMISQGSMSHSSYWRESIYYELKSGDFRFAAVYGLGEGTSNSVTNKDTGIGIEYKNFIMPGFDIVYARNTDDSVTGAGNQDYNEKVTLTKTFKMEGKRKLKVWYMYEDVGLDSKMFTGGNNDGEVDWYGITYKSGPMTLQYSYAETDASQGPTYDRDGYNIGMQYKLSKTSRVYIGHSSSDAGSGDGVAKDIESTMIGLRHDF